MYKRGVICLVLFSILIFLSMIAEAETPPVPVTYCFPNCYYQGQKVCSWWGPTDWSGTCAYYDADSCLDAVWDQYCDPPQTCETGVCCYDTFENACNLRECGSAGCGNEFNCGYCEAGYSCVYTAYSSVCEACSNECPSDGFRECVPSYGSNRAYRTCSVGADGCLDWGSVTLCPRVRVDGVWVDQVCNPIDGSCCTPRCTDKVCGSDGCGGSCGSCPPSQTCSNGACVVPCSSFTSESACRNKDYCDWCPECVGTMYTGGVSRCVDKGGACSSSCTVGKCYAACLPGTTQACSVDGESGTQTCSAGCVWGECIVPLKCVLANARWDVDTCPGNVEVVSAGDTIDLIANGNDVCDGKSFKFRVFWKDDPDDVVSPNPLDSIFSGGNVDSSWIVFWQDANPLPLTTKDPEYSFFVEASGVDRVYSSNKLKVCEVGGVPDDDCDGIDNDNDICPGTDCDSEVDEDGCSPGQVDCVSNIDCSGVEWSECDDLGWMHRDICVDPSDDPRTCCNSQDTCLCTKVEFCEGHSRWIPVKKKCVAGGEFPFFTTLNVLVVLSILMGYYAFRRFRKR